MDRRGFLGLLCGLPFLGVLKLNPKKEINEGLTDDELMKAVKTRLKRFPAKYYIYSSATSSNDYIYRIWQAESDEDIALYARSIDEPTITWDKLKEKLSEVVRLARG